ncbi:MAG TPA: sulfite oxidase-like oxidoreductase [Candidatus Dormibacteraeota bacterium]|nr:sulfite oxidase-like oxidoreductase [Candidatus Dormibacteraeota bacterium]
MAFISRGFRGKRRDAASNSRVPPGQHVVGDFPVLSAGPTPRPDLARWSFTINGEIDSPKVWTWDEFRRLPTEEITVDIHCVTKWSKLDTRWKGVSVDTLMEGVDTAAEYAIAFSDGGYTTNMPLDEITGRKAWVVYEYDGQPLHPEHGGPVRLLVPHLYLWKSAKWVRGITLKNEDEPGFWETNGYNNHGDPWREQRYWGD